MPAPWTWRCPATSRTFPVAARAALFRAAQEGVTNANARRHAGARRVTIRAAVGGSVDVTGRPGVTVTVTVPAS